MLGVPLLCFLEKGLVDVLPFFLQHELTCFHLSCLPHRLHAACCPMYALTGHRLVHVPPLVTRALLLLLLLRSCLAALLCCLQGLMDRFQKKNAGFMGLNLPSIFGNK